MYLLTPFTHFTDSHLHSGNHQFALFPWTQVFGWLKIPPVSDNVWYLSFSVWLISLHIIPSRSTHVVVNYKFLFYFFCMSSIPLCIYICVYMCVCVSFWISVFIFFGYVPRSGIIGSDGSSIFHFWGNPMLYSTVATPSYIPTNSVQFSSSVVSSSLRSHGQQNVRFPCPSPAPRVYSNLCLFSRWCHPTISSSVIPFSSCLQSLPASGSVPIISSSHQAAKVLEFQLQHQFFQWIFRTDFL